MVYPNAGDVALWFLLALAYFRSMDSGFWADAAGPIAFGYCSWRSSLVKASLVALPLPVWALAEGLRYTPLWDAVALIAIVCIATPMAFPYLRIDLERHSFSERVTRWLVTRLDIAAKKGLALLVLSFAVSFVSVDWAHQHIPIPGYFTQRDFSGLGTFTVALLAMAFLSVFLRATIVVALSKLMACLLLPIALMLIGYAIDLGGSIARSSVPLSIGILVAVAVDLATFLLGKSHAGA